MAQRRSIGEGSVYRRKDGRYVGSAYLLTITGARKRIYTYGKSRSEARANLLAVTAQVQQGTPLPDSSWGLAEYLDYWLQQIVRPNRRPATYDLYEGIIRLYLKPGIGAKKLGRLSVQELQAFLNRQLAAGRSVRQVQAMRAVLGTALTQAMREELIMRNVARLVETPTWERKEIYPWTGSEAAQFLEAARGDQLEAAFNMLVFYGLRKGEVLGLRWGDIDLENRKLRIRQQVHRAGGKLLVGPLKTRAGKRDLPLLNVVETALTERRNSQSVQKQNAGESWHCGDIDSDLIFTTVSGRPVDPKNFNRSFERICAEHGVRRIAVHHVRHTAATLLKDLGIPVRDVQLILGHSNIVTTQQIYQHDTLDSRRTALEQVENLLSSKLKYDESGRSLMSVDVDSNSCQTQVSSLSKLQQNRLLISGGARGTRTPDLLHAISVKSTVRECVQSVDSVISVLRRQWILGFVAVTIAVKASHGAALEIRRSEPASK
jgi:integrase